MTTQIIAERSVSSEKGTTLFAKFISRSLKAGDTLLFYGELGSGKTFMIRELVRHLGLEDMVSSPTFSIINQYQGGKFMINHIDLYRIESEKELLNLGLDDFWGGAYINFIEWPQIIEHMLDWPYYRLNIETSEKRKTWRRFILKYVYPGN